MLCTHKTTILCQFGLFCHQLTTIPPSILNHFWWELYHFLSTCVYATYDQNFPSESEERAGYWVGFGEHCGDAMTHKILDHDTQKNIYRSAVRPKKSSTPNHWLAPHGGRFLHLLTLLKIKFPLDHHLDT